MLGPVGESGQAPVGVILAGGQGRRIGGQKALIELAGRPLIQWIAAAAGQAFPEVWAVAKAGTELPELPATVPVALALIVCEVYDRRRRRAGPGRAATEMPSEAPRRSRPADATPRPAR